MTGYVATNLKHADDVFALENRSLFVGLPLLVSLVAVTTWVKVGRALPPAEAIRSQIARSPAVIWAGGSPSAEPMTKSAAWRGR